MLAQKLDNSFSEGSAATCYGASFHDDAQRCSIQDAMMRIIAHSPVCWHRASPTSGNPLKNHVCCTGDTTASGYR